MKKDILFVINNLHIGGVQKSLINLIKEINNEYTINLLVFNFSGDYIQDIPKDIKVIQGGFPLNTLGMSLSEARSKGLYILFAKALLSTISRLFGNVIAINLTLLFCKKLKNYYCAISYMHTGPKKLFFGGTNEFVLKKVSADHKITFIHCDYRNCGSNIKYAGFLYSKFEKLVFCSSGCKNVFVELVPHLEEKSVVIYNTHDDERIIYDANSNPYEYNNDKFNILVVSRLTKDKGIDLAINSINDCIKRFGHKQINLHLIGEGKDGEEFKKLVSQLGLRNNVFFHGNRHNPYAYMVNADILLLTSRHEAAPMVFDEAQILNLPILATPTTSTTEMIIDRCAGWICDNNPKSISHALHQIITNDSSLAPIKKHIYRKTSLEDFRTLINNLS